MSPDIEFKKYNTLAFRLRCNPPFRRVHVIAWWIEEFKTDLSDQSKRDLSQSLNDSFDENSERYLP